MHLIEPLVLAEICGLRLAGLGGIIGHRAALEQLPETLVFCGHSHWELPYTTLSNGTQIMNADGKAFILLPA
ncbi:hypothetical protein [Paenibacillus algorifonticola]|nr:hypothetical protein [Paenibacillus algorifonticola]